DTHYRWFLPLFPRAIESLDLSGYDAVVSVSHAVAKGARARRGAPHLSIVLTPMRYVWDLEAQYFPPGRFPWPLSAYVRRRGGGQEEAKLHALAPRGTEFRSGVTDAELARLLAGARALLFPGEEDFGIMPLEAMASGTPVIAFGRGGALETVGRGGAPDALAKVGAGGLARVPGGMLFGTQTADAVAAAVAAFEKKSFDPAVLVELARPFSGERFDAEIRAALAAAGIPPAG